MKNWFGQECHPSDELFSWREARGTRAKSFPAKVAQVREAWRKIYAAGLEDQLELLLEKQRDVCEANAADDLDF